MKQAHEYRRDDHRVHLIIYHLIWCPRRRKPVLVGETAARCRALIEGKCAEHGWDMLASAIQPDHIHLSVRVWPSDNAAEVVKVCKGITSFHLRAKSSPPTESGAHGASMGTRASFASTAGNVSRETLQRYIVAQTGSLGLFGAARGS